MTVRTRSSDDPCFDPRKVGHAQNIGVVGGRYGDADLVALAMMTDGVATGLVTGRTRNYGLAPLLRAAS